jgi:hypothetical protein
VYRMCASVLIGMFVVVAGGGGEGDDGEKNGK